MKRGRRMVLVVHCILNANSRAEGIADHAGMYPLVMGLASRGIGIVQLPCPEIVLGGPDRPKQTKEAYGEQGTRAYCARIADEIASQVRAYLQAGYSVEAVIGMEGSPTCGVTRTTPSVVGRREPGQGILVEEMRRSLDGLGIPFLALDSKKGDHGASDILSAIDEAAEADTSRD